MCSVLRDNKLNDWTPMLEVHSRLSFIERETLQVDELTSELLFEISRIGTILRLDYILLLL